MKLSNHENVPYILGFWDLKTGFAPLGPKRPKSWTLIHFSQTRPPFNQNLKINLINLSKTEICLHPGAWVLITWFIPIWPKRLKKPCSQKKLYIYDKYSLRIF